MTATVPLTETEILREAQARAREEYLRLSPGVVGNFERLTARYELEIRAELEEARRADEHGSIA
jgi:hypothetical protein